MSFNVKPKFLLLSALPLHLHTSDNGRGAADNPALPAALVRRLSYLHCPILLRQIKRLRHIQHGLAVNIKVNPADRR